jgi:hypothetical protein
MQIGSDFEVFQFFVVKKGLKLQNQFGLEGLLSSGPLML